MEICSKCNEPVGQDAVLLKAGTYMCAACFQKKYLPNAVPAAKNSERNYISVEAIALLVVVVGILFGGYLWMANEREARIAKERADREFEQKREKENAINEAKVAEFEKARKAEEAERKAAEKQRDADRIKQMNLVNAASAAQAKERQERSDALRREEEQKRNAEEQKRDANVQAEAAQKKLVEKQEQEKDLAEAARKRNADVADLKKTISDGMAVIAKAEADKAMKDKALTVNKTIFETRKRTCEDMEKMYHDRLTRHSKPGEAWKSTWDPKYILIVKTLGNSSVSKEPESGPIAIKFNAASKEAQEADAAIKKIQGELDTLAKTIADAQSNVMAAKKSLADIPGATVAEENRPARTRLDTTVEPGLHTRNPKFKTLYKKDGTSIQIQSMIAVDKEVHYKDDKGKMHVIAKDDVDKIENNDAVSEKELESGVKKSDGGKGIGF